MRRCPGNRLHPSSCHSADACPRWVLTPTHSDTQALSEPPGWPATFVWFPRCSLQVASQAGAGAVLGLGEVFLSESGTQTHAANSRGGPECHINSEGAADFSLEKKHSILNWISAVWGGGSEGWKVRDVWMSASGFHLYLTWLYENWMCFYVNSQKTNLLSQPHLRCVPFSLKLGTRNDITINLTAFQSEKQDGRLHSWC